MRCWLPHYMPSTRRFPNCFYISLLYLGAGIGMYLMEKLRRNHEEQPLTRQELPYTVAMMVLDIAAPIFLMIGLTRCSAAKTSTYYAVSPFIGAALSLLIFREIPSVTFWVALVVMAAGTYLASVEVE